MITRALYLSGAWFTLSLVVMLRSVGVAARYASGYAPGDYDYVDGVRVVREQDAHAWAEVYFPGCGWIGLTSFAITNPASSQPTV